MHRLLIPLLLITTVMAQQETIIDMDGTVIKKDKIAVPDFDLKETSGILNAPWKTLNEVLRNDLTMSGFLEVLPESRIKLIKSPHQGAIDFEEWGSIEARHLVVGSVRTKDGQMYVEVRLYEIATKQHIIAKAYRSTPKLARKTAHFIADDIMLHLRNIRFATSKIVFTKTRPKKGSGGQVSLSELYMMDYDGYDPLPITGGGIALAPSAVKINNETMLAYCVYEKPFTFDASYGIYYKPNLVSRPQVLFSDRNRRASAPALSADGRKVAFSIAKDGNVDIFVMNLDGSDLLRLTRHPSVDTNPSWSPGGKSILYTSDRTGAPQIYMMDADGLNNRRITYENPYNDRAVWNPHYDYMAYVSRFDNDFDIFVMDLKTGKNYRVTHRQGSNEDPYWSPDGEHLCFASNRTGKWQIYIVNRNGENLVQITNKGNNANPVWIP